MSMNKPDGENGGRFKSPRLREFDTMLQMLHPSERAGFIDSVYADCLKENNSMEFDQEMAELLLKWSNEKHNFRSHAEKLLRRVSNPTAETREITGAKVEHALKEE